MESTFAGVATQAQGSGGGEHSASGNPHDGDDELAVGDGSAGDSPNASGTAGDSLNATDAAEIVDWQQAHAELVRLATMRAGLDCEEGHWLLVALRSGAHRRLGFASFLEYMERLFGYSPRFAQERLRVAEALEDLPILRQALSAGTLSWSIVRELTRVATPKTEAEWIRAGRGRTSREVERLVSGRRLGDSPGDPPDRAARRHVIRLEVSADAFAMFREAMAKLRRDSGGALDDDAAVLMMTRQVLGGPTDAGRASYQVALTVCDRCRHAEQQGRGEPIPIEPEVVEMAECDAQYVATTTASTHVGQTESGSATSRSHETKPARATQTVPPAVRRAVMIRDGRCCAVPGCRHATFLDLHHLDPRAEGGDHDPDNLLTVCGAHHLALHRGDLAVEGRVSTGLAFRHADGTQYGGAVSPRAAEVRGTVFRAMRGLGFKESDARRAVERAASELDPQTTTEALLRAALAATPPKRGRAQESSAES